jgi:hypothetical protein
LNAQLEDEDELQSVERLSHEDEEEDEHEMLSHDSDDEEEHRVERLLSQDEEEEESSQEDEDDDDWHSLDSEKSTPYSTPTSEVGLHVTMGRARRMSKTKVSDNTHVGGDVSVRDSMT